jgi:protein-disulfide isomerase
MPFTLPRSVRAALFAATLTLLATTAFAQAPMFTPEQRGAIGSIIREYLLQNPEVLQEAISELERRQGEAQKTAQAAALGEERERLFNSPRGAVVGNPAGDVALVEFFDYNCGYCKRALTDLRALVKADPKLKLVLRDFPVLGPDSVEASRVSLAAKQQLKGEKLFDYHTRVMETKGRVNGERALAVARRWASTWRAPEGSGRARRSRRRCRRTSRSATSWVDGHAGLRARGRDHPGGGGLGADAAGGGQRAAVREGVLRVRRPRRATVLCRSDPQTHPERLARRASPDG